MDTIPAIKKEKAYLRIVDVVMDLIARGEVGYDDHFYTEQELIDADLVGQKNGRIYDRFRNRLMFPIIDVRGNVIGFGGRIMKKDDNAAKYLNSPETLIFNKRKNLFGLNFAKKTKLSNIILVEGNIDVVTLHQFGFDNAVASLGTAPLLEVGKRAVLWHDMGCAYYHLIY